MSLLQAFIAPHSTDKAAQNPLTTRFLYYSRFLHSLRESFCRFAGGQRILASVHCLQIFSSLPHCATPQVPLLSSVVAWSFNILQTSLWQSCGMALSSSFVHGTPFPTGHWSLIATLRSALLVVWSRIVATAARTSDRARHFGFFGAESGGSLSALFRRAAFVS